jgi:hypothetical protein
MGTSCPYRHVRGDKTVVCKHWLRGLCKKGDGCEFLARISRVAISAEKLACKFAA